jgi:DNA-binding MarR family transcriptional regulator
MVEKRQSAVNSRTAAGEAFSELVVRVFQLEGVLAAAGDEIASPLGQSTARWRVLAAVEREPLTVARIARDWKLARQSIQRVADGLADDALVTYEENPAHRRAKLVQLTAEGRRVLHRIQAKQATWANEAGAAIGAPDLAAANALLADILEALERE